MGGSQSRPHLPQLKSEIEKGTAMESESVPANSKRLLLDGRYGWVFDEWKEPSEEALSGGRGMFCIVPLAKAFVDKVNLVATTTLNGLQRPDKSHKRF